MNFENMENIKKDQPKKVELELELPVDKKEPIKKDPSVGLNDVLLDLKDFEPKETVEDKLKKAAQEATASVNKIDKQEKEKREGDMGHLLMLEEKIKKLEVAIAQGGDYQQDLIFAKQEYDKYFKEYIEKNKK